MSAAIDVAIGLAFLYLILALVVTTVQELIATYLSWRAKDLYAAIEKMLQDSGTTPDRAHRAAKISAGYHTGVSLFTTTTVDAHNHVHDP